MVKKVLAFFCFTVIVICLLLPASIFFKKTEEYISGLKFSEITGFLWGGSLHNVSFLQRGYRMPIGHVSWKFSGKSFSSLALCVDFLVESEETNGDGHGCFSLFSERLELDVDNFHLRIPAAEISELSGIAIDGAFDIKVQYLMVKNGQLSNIRSDIIWSKALFHNGEKWLSLGDVLFNITSPKNRELRVNILDLQSPIKIDVLASFYDGEIKTIKGAIDSRMVDDESWLTTLDLFSQRKEGKQYIFYKTF